MISFKKLDPAQRDLYLPYLAHAAHRGCTYSFANLCLWGRQQGALVEGHLVIFSHFSGHSMYPFPMGSGNVRPVIDAIIQDAEKRGIPFRLAGLTRTETDLLEALYPGRFRFHCNRDIYDYVYAIDDLAELKGRKYQQKRNHIHRFEDACPDWSLRPFSDEVLEECRRFTDEWYRRRAEENPHEDIKMEQAALNRAYRHWKELGMEGLVLYSGGAPVAMTLASFLSSDTLDVHFEKARTDIPGAYAFINRAFARHIREKYPHVAWLNREDDTGSEGLRKAKLSYHPHHLVEKCWALLTEEEYDE